MIRIQKVGKFRIELIDLIYNYTKRCIELQVFISHKEVSSIYDRFLEDVSFSNMLYSFKKLELESFYTDQEIRELLHGPTITKQSPE